MSVPVAIENSVNLLCLAVVLLDIHARSRCVNRKRQDYAYVKREYQCTFQKIKPYSWRENKVNKNKDSSYCETLWYT